MSARIIVVDNEADQVDLLVTALRNEGYEVAGVTDAPAALAEIARAEPAVVLTDLRMEGMDGLAEVGDMTLALQAKLLRVLEDKAVRPVGGRESVQLDFRVVSATNTDLAARVREGRFREDLYYRLAVIPVRLPSLRERPEDIRLLARHFLERAAAETGKPITSLAPDALEWLIAHSWPGTVRELENAVTRAVALATGPTLTLREVRPLPGMSSPSSGRLRPTLAEFQTRYVRDVLEETGGDRRAAARILGVSVRTLQRWAKDQVTLGPASPAPAEAPSRLIPTPPRGHPASLGCPARDASFLA